MFYLYNFIDIFAHGYKNYDAYKKSNKQTILLLGDGFVARGFLSTIDYNKYNITQIYRDEFINPQDIFYSLQKRSRSFKLKNKHILEIKFILFFNKNNITKIKQDINTLQISKNNTIINNKWYNFDYMVIGLDAKKSLKRLGR